MLEYFCKPKATPQFTCTGACVWIACGTRVASEASASEASASEASARARDVARERYCRKWDFWPEMFSFLTGWLNFDKLIIIFKCLIPLQCYILKFLYEPSLSNTRTALHTTFYQQNKHVLVSELCKSQHIVLVWCCPPTKYNRNFLLTNLLTDAFSQP